MRTGPALREHWAGGPRTYLGIQAAGFPNFFFFFFFIIGGPQSTTGNILRYTEVQANWVADCIASMRDQGFTRVETTAEGEEYWSDLAYSTIKGTLQETTSTSSWAWARTSPAGAAEKPFGSRRRFWNAFAHVLPLLDVHRGRRRPADPGPVRGVPRRAPR